MQNPLEFFGVYVNILSNSRSLDFCGMRAQWIRNDPAAAESRRSHEVGLHLQKVFEGPLGLPWCREENTHHYTHADHMHSGHGVHPSPSYLLSLLLCFSPRALYIFTISFFFDQQVNFSPALKCCALFLPPVFSCCISASLTFPPHACSQIYFAYFQQGSSRRIWTCLA